MYPLKFENLYFEKIWGGEGFKLFRNNVPGGKVGESWDIACHYKGISLISNGKYKGISLDKLIQLKGKDLVGAKLLNKPFPLLVKTLNTSAKLSVQVHPNDEFAMVNEGEMGKAEAWYIMDAEENSFIILGTKECTKEEFKKALKNNNIEKYMNIIPVNKGEVYYVKPGLIHALGPGIIAVEIQQNSDITYRVYDYNRDRKLHIKKALKVINFNEEGRRCKGIKIENESFDKIYYCLNEYFALELYHIKTSMKGKGNKKRFYIYTCVEGNGVIKYTDGEEKINIGDSILIPAALGSHVIEGKLKLLKSYVPNVKEVEKEILDIIRQ